MFTMYLDYLSLIWVINQRILIFKCKILPKYFTSHPARASRSPIAERSSTSPRVNWSDFGSQRDNVWTFFQISSRAYFQKSSSSDTRRSSSWWSCLKNNWPFSILSRNRWWINFKPTTFSTMFYKISRIKTKLSESTMVTYSSFLSLNRKFLRQ